MSGCVVILIDESADMRTGAARAAVSVGPQSMTPKPRFEVVATAVNSLLNRLSQAPDFDVALIGYRIDGAGADETVNVGSRWAGGLAGREFVQAAELAGAQVRTESRQRAVGGAAQTVDFPIWYEPTVAGKAPQTSAFAACQQLLSTWSGNGAPLVVNISSGASGDGNPFQVVQEIQGMAFPGGAPVVMQAHLAAFTKSDALAPTLYPANRALTPAGQIRDVFDRTSVLPDEFVEVLRAADQNLNPGARAMVYNGKMIDLTRMLGLVHSAATSAPVAAPAEQVAEPDYGAPPTDVDASPTTPDEQAQPVADEQHDPVGPGRETFQEEETSLDPMPGYDPSAEEPGPDAHDATVPYAAMQSTEPAPPVDNYEQTPVDDSYTFPAADEQPVDDEWSQPDTPAPGLPPESTPPAGEIAPGMVTPENPALVLFVLDRSVESPFAVDIGNPCGRLLERLGDMVGQTAKSGQGCIDVGLISYGADSIGEVDVRNTLEGGLLGRQTARDSEIEGGAIRIDQSEDEIDNGVGNIITVSRWRPVLAEIEPSAACPATPAFTQAAGMIATWRQEHPTSAMPPIVMHLTRGALDPDDMSAAVDLVRSAAADCVLYHLVETESQHPEAKYPASPADLQTPQLQHLWELSSPLLEVDELSLSQPGVDVGSRGLVVNVGFNLLLNSIKNAME